MLRINVNGKLRELDVDPDTPLLWVLRDSMGLKGTKYGCGVGVCGICTVLSDGEPLRSCVVPLREVVDRQILTIEALAENGHPALAAWIGQQVPQCGYCQPGQILAAAALLRRHPHPDDTEILSAMGGILCRCGTYQRIRRAIRAASTASAGETLPLPPVSAGPGVALDDWIRIAPDGRVTLIVNHSEMGQGVATALATLVAEELEVDPAEVRTEFAPAEKRYRNPIFKVQTTGGSTSVRGEWERLSLVAARARLRLVAAAAQRWGVKAEDCLAEKGRVVHAPSERRLSYGELALAAAGIEPPKRVALKRPEECRLLGRALPRPDIPDMVAGRTIYGLDLELPGMRMASLVRCPVFGGKLASFDASKSLSVPGVERVVQISRGVAVVARDTWAALRGRAALEVRWEPGPNSGLDTAALWAQLEAAVDQPGDVRQRVGHVNPVFRHATRIVEAEYRTAPLAHATLEPMNCTARITKDGCEVWLGTQSQEDVLRTAAKVSGMPCARVKVHSQFLGGGFGRRLETDMVVEAVELAKAVGAPIQVVWTRADDLRHDHYRPACVARLRAVLDGNGWPRAWFQRSAGHALAGEAPAKLAYAIPNVRTEFVAVDSPIPSGPWRSVGAGQDAFAVESFVDELAHTAGRDPFEYRHMLLSEAPRQRRVLELAAQAAGWGSPSPTGWHRGIAVYPSFGSYVAEVAEVAVDQTGVRVPRVVCAIDCGRTVNPDIIRAQIEGSVALGLSAALKEEVRIERGRVAQSSFEDYPILTLGEMPEVEVHIVESKEAPGGVGEPGVPPVAPAVANAVAAATRNRLRSLPLGTSG